VGAIPSMLEEKVIKALFWSSLFVIIAIFVLIFITSNKSSYTELYFEDPQNLPSLLNIGQEQNFSFSLVNHKGKTSYYSYNVYIIYDGKEETRQIIDTEVITLDSEEGQTFVETFISLEGYSSAEVLVEADNKKIFFFLK